MVQLNRCLSLIVVQNTHKIIDFYIDAKTSGEIAYQSH